ncbi:MAG: PEP/pyruvate-binding domain-containing protein [Anaerolineae bacterium]|nr:PEP/pyruvate-binding domain-containing protein [Anaerolineae bacterium]
MSLKTAGGEPAREYRNPMQSLDLGAPKVLELVLELKQYPILSNQIRERMRQEIFQRGVITREDFEREARQKAIDSQRREGLVDPLDEEAPDIWQRRMAIIRDDLTDFYFAHNFPHDLFEQIVHEFVAKRTPDKEFVLTVNPELAPWAILFALGEQYESYPPEEKARIQHHLKESIVVLSKGMLSDHLDFVGLAREFLTIADLREIRSRRIGRGKIGGKAAGMLMAWKIWQKVKDQEAPEFANRIALPDSCFVAADVFYEFQALNNLTPYMNQKYKDRDEIEADYPTLHQAYMCGKFPPYVVQQLEQELAGMGKTPLVVRSSSLLEDNFGFSFAGKYDSFFLPNQGTPKENLQALLRAISAVYASALSPDALIYRRRMGLLDYDERMAVLIQKVIGEPYRDYFFPALAGVAFSRNPFRWNQRIRREDGMIRLVLGLGTRAVDRVASDYPRMIALSHPTLRPEVGAQTIKYSQHLVDVLNLRTNECETLAASQLIDGHFPGLKLIASIDEGGYVQPMLSLLNTPSPESLVLTFDTLITKTDFCEVMKSLLQTIEKHYKRPVDIEFAVRRLSDRSADRCEITLLQCRPLSFRQEGQPIAIPAHIPPDDTIFSANRLVPQGIVSGVRYIIWIDPRTYDQIPDTDTRLELARTVGQLNYALEDERFILMGPGRWGSSNLSLGVKVSYADISNARMLIEVALAHGEQTPEVSYGTHFFQDLVESQIYPLPLYPDDDKTTFNWKFIQNSPNVLGEIIPQYAHYAPYIKVIDVSAVTGGYTIEIIMNGEQEKALAFIKR